MSRAGGSKFRLLTDIRFELLALLPIAAGTATARWRLGKSDPGNPRRWAAPPTTLTERPD